MPVQRMYVLWCEGWPELSGHEPFHEPEAQYASEVSDARKLGRESGWRVPDSKKSDQRILCAACWDHKLMSEHGVQKAVIVA